MMRWVTNTIDHTIPGWERYVMAVYRGTDTTPSEAVENHKNYLKGKIVGPPKATPKYSAEELLDQGYIGLYIEENNHGER